MKCDLEVLACFYFFTHIKVLSSVLHTFKLRMSLMQMQITLQGHLPLQSLL